MENTIESLDPKFRAKVEPILMRCSHFRIHRARITKEEQEAIRKSFELLWNKKKAQEMAHDHHLEGKALDLVFTSRRERARALWRFRLKGLKIVDHARTTGHIHIQER